MLHLSHNRFKLLISLWQHSASKHWPLLLDILVIQHWEQIAECHWKRCSHSAFSSHPPGSPSSFSFTSSTECVFFAGFQYVTKMYQVKCQHGKQVIKLDKRNLSYGGPEARQQTNSSHFSRGCIRFGLNVWATQNWTTGLNQKWD